MAGESSNNYIEVAFTANTWIQDGAKNTLEWAIKSGLFAESSALKALGAKFTIVGNVDKILTVGIAYESGSKQELISALINSTCGLAGGVGGAWLGRRRSIDYI
ncbi:hypothetical protein [Syntrophorhabdus aromaticivorans]|uniref:hypothetical protein n=1 Tax=Syntrophorhabdus aromaticivorans TaxID=328301 RepID=UPI000415BC83|nr:hypothetical protein [Syntrophorhabdus aromaticivorans]